MQNSQNWVKCYRCSTWYISSKSVLRGRIDFKSRRLKFRSCWFISSLCHKLNVWSWPGQFCKLMCLTFYMIEVLWLLWVCTQTYPAYYEHKPFAGSKLVCVQFSLCKMGIIIFFLPYSMLCLFYLSILLIRGHKSCLSLYVCELVIKESLGIIWTSS